MEFSIPTAAILLIALVLLFEFSNGFNDCANLVVTPVITGAMGPRKVILLIAVFEFIGAWFLGTAVAQTLGKGIVNPQYITAPAILAAVCGAIVWNLGGWYFGMPSSSSHALIGGLVGAVVTGSGIKWIDWVKVGEVLAILVLTPALGLVGGRYMTLKVSQLFQGAKPSRANPRLKQLEVLTSITLALSHGTNDAQKGMGLISLSLIIFHKMSPGQMGAIYRPLPDYGFYVPDWVILICSLALALGVSSGGWRIMKTLGTRLYKVRPIHGFSAQACASIIIYLSSFIGFPVSTTQIVSSSILGAGSAQGFGAVRWGIGKQIFLTWAITIPGSAALSAIFFLVLKIFL
ncbi:MAG: inorganic phosphate transporter [Syntrophaceae bacterium]|nr:inorganic phosphate transporter [Syntrophaceae bacterium]